MNKLSVSSSPHIRSSATTNRIMLDVIIALLPTAIMGVVIFGWRALAVIATCVASAVLSEFVFNLIVKKEQTIGDLSAVVTGLILALNLRADAPIWQCVIGSVFAIVVVKCLFGGLGCNFANPAATARIFLLICFAGTLGGGAIPKISSAPELVSGATPLSVLKNGGALPSLLDMFLGFRGGAIGEACIAAILLGFVYLVVRRVIHFETPLILVATVFVLSLIVDNSFTVATYQMLAGGLVFASVFMATDYVTTPITRSGKMIYAVGCGLITFLIRYFGNYPEGVSFSILLMNILSPYIEKWTAPRALGGKKA
ncbi:MAG: RnfABCDGE type electron transport complex subunit D [Clostridia bacterium]|nr:RnfABCDGE type electron transport complex subunit D [Clostridia bacterium]